MPNPVFLKRVVLNNYKSIKECSVELGPLTFLVGPNGAGKSNFLDALRLITEALNTSLEHALRDRGGINEVRRRSSGHPTHFGVRLEWQLPDKTEGFYAFRVGSQKNGGFAIQREECWIYGPKPKMLCFGVRQSREKTVPSRSQRPPQSPRKTVLRAKYQVENGNLKQSSFKTGPAASVDRLYLVSVSGLLPFRPLYDALSHMGFYNFNPLSIRELQPPDPGEVLKRDGSNLASVLDVMAKENKEAHRRVILFLSKVTPGIQGISIKHLGKNEALEFRQSVGAGKSIWRFPAESMSDGTLRSLGVLTALFQSSNGKTRRVPFVGIEEPEVAVHPGAAGVLRDGLYLASETTQIAVTSHSPDLLDDKDLSDDSIKAVINQRGETVIAPLNEAERSVIRDRLYTAGELLRIGQIEPNEAEFRNIDPKQLDLFAEYRP